MIAKVRIAPIERWCRISRAEHDYHCVVGLWVEIFTDSMRKPGREAGIECDGRIWKMTDNSDKLWCDTLGVLIPGGDAWICEHMLELD